MQTLSIGSTLQGGKYIIKDVLGQGGFGITYLAEHDLLGTRVAIKEFFFKQYCEREESTSHITIGTVSNRGEVLRYQEKFLKEARTIARLNHPNIIKIHDVFKENNTAYYVMDFLSGENLSQIVKNRGALPEPEAINYIQQIGNALSYIHSQNLNHLDVKPANIMITDNGMKAVLIDFGTSKQYDNISGNQTSTTPVGISHGYAPIELYKEGGVREYSPKTDIYSLGATLYKLISGNTPAQATDIAVDGWQPVFLSGTSYGVRVAISSAMEVKKQNRPESVADFLKYFEDEKTKQTIEQIQVSLDNEETHILANNVEPSNYPEDKVDHNFEQDESIDNEQFESNTTNNRSESQDSSNNYILKYVIWCIVGFIAYLIIVNLTRSYIRDNYIYFNGFYSSHFEGFGWWIW